MLDILKTALNNKVIITIVTRPVSDFKNKEQKNMEEMHEYINTEDINLFDKSNLKCRGEAR